MIDLKDITDQINKETASVPTFTLEWLESRLKPKFGAVMYVFTLLIDNGQLLYSHTKRVLSKDGVVDRLFYKRKDTQHEERRN